MNTSPLALGLSTLIALSNLILATHSHADALLDEALDVDQQGLQTSSSTVAKWTRSTTGSSDGVDVAVSPVIGHDSKADFTVAMVGPDTVSFWWKVSSEDTYDVMQFLIGDVVSKQISGETSWTNEVVSIPAGFHILKWQYTKDDGFVGGQDRAWVDDIRFDSRALAAIQYPETVGAHLDQPFEILPETAGKADTYTLTGSTPDWLHLDPTSGRIYGTPTTLGDVSVIISATNAIGTSNLESITIQVSDLGSGLETLASGWHWGGAEPWSSQTSKTHDGKDALRSGAIGDDASSELRLPVTGPALVRFWWSVDSEGAHDELAFLIDDSIAKDIHGEAARISEFQDWQRCLVVVPEGSHSLTWRYQKDASNSDGADAGWLDDIEILDERDPDSDGFSTIVEAALGMDWRVASTDVLNLPWEDTNQLHWQVVKGSDAEGINQVIEISYDLKNWSATLLEVSSEDASQRTFRERTPFPSSQKFIRVRANLAP